MTPSVQDVCRTPQLDPSPALTPPAAAARRNMRFATASDAQALRITDDQGQDTIATLENESFTGIAARAHAVDNLQAGMNVTVEYYGHPTKGVLRRVAQDQDATWLLAVQWR
jgi:hypothetical protein